MGTLTQKLRLLGVMIVIDETDDLNSEFTKLSFEKIIERLGETVQVLETGGLGLDDTIKLFENGMKMARVCSEMLAAAELRVSRIKTTYVSTSIRICKSSFAVSFSIYKFSFIFFSIRIKQSSLSM